MIMITPWLWLHYISSDSFFGAITEMKSYNKILGHHCNKTRNKKEEYENKFPWFIRLDWNTDSSHKTGGMRRNRTFDFLYNSSFSFSSSFDFDLSSRLYSNKWWKSQKQNKLGKIANRFIGRFSVFTLMKRLARVVAHNFGPGLDI
jgi:hypothetical protein